MGKNKNGFEKYKEVFDSIEKQCNDKTFVRQVREHGNNFGRFHKQEKSNHYLLENGLHVYINEESIVVSNDELQKYKWVKDENINQIYMKMDKKDKQCQLYMEKKSSFIGEVIYGSEYYYDENQKKEVRDYSYLPTDWNSKDFKQQSKYENYGEVSENLEKVLDEALQRSENSETENIYREAIKLNFKTLQVKDKDKILNQSTFKQRIAVKPENKLLNKVKKENNKEKEVELDEK